MLAKGEGDENGGDPDLTLADVAKTPGGRVSGLAPVEQRWWFAALQLGPAALLAGLWGWDRRRRFLREHPEVVLKRRARRGLRRQLRAARRAAAARDRRFRPEHGRGPARGLRAAWRANPAALVCADVLAELPQAEQQGHAGEMVSRLFAAADALSFGGPVREGPQELLSLEPEPGNGCWKPVRAGSRARGYE